ncbi:MAG: arginine deiminase [Eubacteriaceae bacterium]|nr:arginine deiminase [Eubacteriaceae bacterium]
MHPGIHNFSEIGKLNKVLLHRPGRELEKLTPGNFERLLFDDIPFLKVAQEEHDRFAEVLRENGVEVVYYQTETAKALQDEKIKSNFVREFVELSEIHSEARKEEIAQYLLGKTPEDLVESVIAGIFTDEIKHLSKRSLIDVVEHDEDLANFASDPMPNLYFTRDPGACVGNGINIHHMSTPARRREALLLKYMTTYNRDFALEDTPMWYDVYGNYSIEGGDVLVLSKDIVAVGYSQRTTLAGIESFAAKLLKNSTFKKVLVFDIPKCRAFMHLDTVFTMVDYDKFTIHPEIEGPLGVYEITLGADGQLKFNAMKDELHKILALELALPAVDLIRCGGGDLIAAQREQWNDGSNTLCIAPGTVVTYERNYVTNDLLDKKGIKVLSIPSAELSRGRGGPRCMSCPVNRDDL